MTRAVIYARFSSDLQSAASIDDQHRAIRLALPRLGFREVGAFGDAAISGASLARPGLDAALAEIEAGRADVLMAEALDRISRDLEHVARIAKRITFRGAKIVTLAEGEIGTLHVALAGAMSAEFLRLLAEKTRRGQAGRVAAGRIAGGRAYGYRTRGAGEFEVEPGEAEVVRRICREYVAGRSPRAIAKALNAEGIASPRGGEWAANVITGNRARQTGIIHNPLYRGRIVWNRQRWRKDPTTGRRVPILNAAADVIEADRPDLRIIPADLAAAIDRREGEYVRRPKVKRPTRPLSGLLVCGCCGTRLTIAGRNRYACPAHRERGTCDNNRTAAAEEVERKVLEALRTHLQTPEALEAYARAYIDETRRLRADKTARAARLRADHAAAERKLANLIALAAAAADAAGAVALAQAVNAAAAEVQRLGSEVVDLGDDRVVEFGTFRPEFVLDHIERLWAMTFSDEMAVTEVRDALSEIVDRIDFIPGQYRGEWHLELVGDLAAILSLATGGPGKSKDGVAGAHKINLVFTPNATGTRCVAY